MAISYPLSTPTTIGFESINIRAVNSVSISQSPYTFKQQIISHGGQKWEASVTIPAVRRDLSAEWKAMLTALKGQTGTFLLGDPDYATPRGTALTCSLTGSAGDEEVAVSISGTILAGDYIQLGSGASARLHQVLQDRIGSGTLDIWPALRDDYSSAVGTLTEPKGVFRLASNSNEWLINSNSSYSISFEAVEALT